MKKTILILSLSFLGLAQAFADVPMPIETEQAPEVLAPINGAALYTEFCAGCHGRLESTRIPDRRPGRIASAIRHFGVMASLKHLSALQIIAISRALESKGGSASGR